MKQMIIILLGIILLAAFCASCSDNNGETYKVTAKSGLKVKETPSGEQIATLPYGEQVEVLEIADDWAKIDYSGQDAYINAKYISKVESGIYRVTAESGLKVKATPNGANIGTLPYAEEIAVIDISNGWAKFDYSGQEAYVSAKYLYKTHSDVPNEGNDEGSFLFWIIIIGSVLLGGGGTAAVVHLKKDGTPDMRFKSNRQYFFRLKMLAIKAEHRKKTIYGII